MIFLSNFLHSSMKSWLLILIIITSLSKTGFSLSHRNIESEKIHQQIKSFGLQVPALNFHKDFFKSILFKNDSTIIYNPNGSLHLFEIDIDTIVSVVKLTNGEFHGHNFKRSLFIHDEIIYSYGGEGLFNFSTKLIYFNPKLKGWYEKEISNYPFNARKVVNSWKYGNKLMVLLNHYSTFDKTSDYKYTQYSFGEIDLTNFEYKINFEFISNDDSGLSLSKGEFNYESDRYLLIVYKTDSEKCRVEIFDKKTGDLLKTNVFENLHFPDGNTFIYIEDSTIYYKNNLGIVDSSVMNLINITERMNYVRFFESKKKTNLIYFIAIFILISLILVILFFKITKKDADIVDKEIIDIEDKLKEFINKRISREELDDLFSISHYSYETIKTRRSLKIKLINERNIIVIERLRKHDDRRFFEYKITQSQ